MEIKTKKCKREACTNEFKQFNSLQTYCCGTCKTKDQQSRPNKPRTPIKKIGAKHAKLLARYSKVRKEFLSRPENKYCPVTGRPATEIHHRKGKTGYADEWARQFNVPLLIDERYFLAVTREGHNKIEANPIWAKANNYSEDRNH